MKKRFFPVIHLKSRDQAHEQVAVAVENGADGVWLISHSDDAPDTHRTFDRVRHRNPELWIGLNLLGFPTPMAMRIVTTAFANGERIDGLWADNGGIMDDGVRHTAKITWETKQDTGWPGEYFGGVAFKGEAPVSDPAKAAKAAARFMDVVTTSGPATGVPAEVGKIRQMKGALGDHRLAVASGITPENVGDYLPYVDDFLVATGISCDFHTLDPAKVRALAALIHGGVEEGPCQEPVPTAE